MNKEINLTLKTTRKKKIKFKFDYNINKMIMSELFVEMTKDFASLITGVKANNNSFVSQFNHQLMYAKENRCGIKFDGEYHTEGNTVKYYSISAKFHKDRNTIEGSINDNTSEKVMIQKTIQAEKLRSLGALAGGIAHDFNNQLMVILGSCEMLKRQYTDPKTTRYLLNIESSVRNSSELINKLLTFGQVEKSPTLPMNIISCVEDTLVILEHTSTKKIRIYSNDFEDKLIIRGNYGLIQNALINVCKNAIEALEEDGLLVVKTSLLNLEKLPYRSVNGLNFATGNYAKIEITDNGTGISPEILERIFDPFFTTKGYTKGTGLGLSTVLGTVESHGGIITVDSVLGKGTTFGIYFKIIEEIKQMRFEFDADRPKVLIVDDEEMIRGILCDILMDIGFSVLSFERGEEAINYYAQNSQKVALVICDMMMPQMTGKEVFYQMRRINPTIKCIILSGYAADEYDAELASSIIGYLKKPILSSELEEVINNALK